MPGCGISTTLKHGYCSVHAHLAKSNWAKFHKGRNRHQRGYGAKWYKLRERVLERDQYLCQHCKSNGRYVRANHVDHIKPKSQGGKDEMSNLQALCKKCHEHKTATERQSPKCR